MQFLRQLGGGVIVGIVSLLFVIGGILLSFAESSAPVPLPTPTKLPPTFQVIFPTPTIFVESTQTATATEIFTVPPLPTDTLSLLPTTCALQSGWNQVFVRAGDTIYSIAQQYGTTPEILSAANCLGSLDLPAGYALLVPPVPATATLIPCGPPGSWVKAYFVQRGDNLFRISLSYGTTVARLQQANCMGSSTTIFAGQVLWVPNVPTRTPFPTTIVIPTIPTFTQTIPPTATTVPPTFTQPPVPTDTLIPTNSPAPTSTTAPMATITTFPTQTTAPP
jgi:LysM repeat protein